jgi:glycosyltransferase involved in cell wall biosynthesis
MTVSGTESGAARLVHADHETTPAYRGGDGQIRALLIAEAANPELASVPLEGWSHARALAGAVEAHLVTQVRNREAIRRAGLAEREFTCIDSERIARGVWRLSNLVRGGSGKGWTTVTALSAVSYLYFERLLWKEFGSRIQRGEFDVVHRLTPLSPTIPSPIAGRCARAGVPFVMGPLNGGVPWPAGFGAVRRREREWLSYVRGAYRLLPGYRATRRHAAALIVGSRDTLAQVPKRYWGKCVYIPENGVDPARFGIAACRAEGPALKVVFVGRLVAYKGADMLLEAAAPLVRAGRVRVEVIGEGPERPALEAMVAREGLACGVTLGGWIGHPELQHRMAAAQVFGFPSIREFGGAVVLEAMALGLVPVVVGYGGPAELVSARTGIAVPIGPRDRIVAGVRAALERLVANPALVAEMGRQARRRVHDLFTWDAKASQVRKVYEWVLGRGPKPEFSAPLPDSAAQEVGV